MGLQPVQKLLKKSSPPRVPVSAAPSILVLVIDDDPSLQKLFVTLLRRQGFDVDCASDGFEGIARLKQRNYNAVLLDLMMPKLSGFEVLQQLERDSPEMLERVIVTTGVSSRIIETIKTDQIYALIRKPFDIDDLIDTTRRCAATQRAHQLQ